MASLIVVQGRWWYRAELRVVPDDTGSRVEETILNVAGRAHWAGPVAGRRVLAAAPAAFSAPNAFPSPACVPVTPEMRGSRL